MSLLGFLRRVLSGPFLRTEESAPAPVSPAVAPPATARENAAPSPVPADGEIPEFGLPPAALPIALDDADDRDDDVSWWRPPPEEAVIEPVELAPDLSDPELQNLLAAARARLESAELALPTISHVAQRALLMLRDDEVDFHAIAELIGRDAALAGEIIRLAGAAAQGSSAPIRTIDAACVRLGQRALRGAILASTLRAAARLCTNGPQRGLGEELWRRSMACGFLARWLAPRVGLEADEAFVIGLLHDVGSLVVLAGASDDADATPLPRPVFEQLERDYHEPLGRRVAEHWELPTPLPELIGAHHAATIARRNGSTSALDAQLASHRALLSFVNAVCALQGFGEYVPYDLLNLPCASTLGLRETAEFATALEQLPDELESWTTAAF